jgi:hypothetical protein
MLTKNADDLPTAERLRPEEGCDYNEEVVAPLFFYEARLRSETNFY